MSIKVTTTQNPKAKPQDESKLGFGRIFTDHMLVMEYSGGKWGDIEIKPYSPFMMDPASMVLHYGQAVFEGMKAYRYADGSVNLFRPEDNFARLNRSSDRLCIPRIDEGKVLRGLKELLRLEKGWVPSSEGTSLYIRPFSIATDAFVGVRVSDTYTFCIILSPVGAYYPDGMKPVSIMVEDEYVRSVRGGMGFAKAAGNYAVSLIADHEAKKHGCAQVLWLDGVERRYIEEVGSMNIFFRIGDELITPALQGSILGGITRDSVIKLAESMGIKVSERPISLDEVRAAHGEGKLAEAFGSGTAAVISPVGSLFVGEEELVINDRQMGEYSARLYENLTGIQFGKIQDSFGWTMPIE